MVSRGKHLLSKGHGPSRGKRVYSDGNTCCPEDARAVKSKALKTALPKMGAPPYSALSLEAPCLSLRSSWVARLRERSDVELFGSQICCRVMKAGVKSQVKMVKSLKVGGGVRGPGGTGWDF